MLNWIELVLTVVLRCVLDPDVTGAPLQNPDCILACKCELGKIVLLITVCALESSTAIPWSVLFADWVSTNIYSIYRPHTVILLLCGNLKCHNMVILSGYNVCPWPLFGNIAAHWLVCACVWCSEHIWLSIHSLSRQNFVPWLVFDNIAAHCLAHACVLYLVQMWCLSIHTSRLEIS